MESYSRLSEQIDFASTDLKRRPFRTTLVLVSLTTVVASTVFLFLFANVLLDVTSFATAGETSSALVTFYETFIWATLLLVLILGIVVVSTNISLEMVSRRKDIGLMKAIGTLIDTLYDHFMAQAVILLLASVVLGCAIGTVLYLGGLFWLATVVPWLDFSFQFPWLQIVFLSLIYLFAGYFSANKPIYDIVHESPVSALNPEVGMRVRRVGYLDTFGLPFRIATKATGRRIKGTRRTILSLLFSFGLASLLWIGGGIVETTTVSYVSRAMGTNIVAVGNPSLLDQYYESYSLSGSLLNSSFDFTENSDIIPSELIVDITNSPGVIRTESRLLDVIPVQEGPGIIWNPTLEQYEYIGNNRTDTALIVGLNWENTLSSWYFEGEEISDSGQAWIGGVLATTMFEDPLIQSIGVRGRSLDITSIAFDILNGGMVAYMDLSEMQEAWGVSGANILLIQLDEYNMRYIERIGQLANGYNLSIYLQEEILEENLASISAIWSLLQPLPVMALISAFLSLMNYLLISVFGRFRDYVIMRSVGARPSFIARTMIAEGVDIGLKAGFLGVLIATLFSIFFLVPEAAVPTIWYLPAVIGIMLIVLLIVVALAAIPVYLLFSSKSDLRVSEFQV
jgi:ABC-type antimicrobial peptide transport system permease subunit